MAKMNACSPDTKISKPTSAIAMANENGAKIAVEATLQHRDRAEEEHREQEVPGHEVGPESDRQGDRPDHDLGEELDRHEQDVERRRRSRRHHDVLQVAEEPVLHDADRVVRDPRDDGHDERERDAAVRREVDARHDLEDVPEEDGEEERGEQRHEPAAVLPRASASRCSRARTGSRARPGSASCPAPPRACAARRRRTR